MADPFAQHGNSPSAPALRCVAVTKADADLPEGTCKALLVGTGGSANLTDAGGGVRSGVPLQQGYNPIRVARISLGGTADNIWALY